MRYKVETSFRGRRDFLGFETQEEIAEYIAHNKSQYFKVYEIYEVKPMDRLTRQYIDNLAKGLEKSDDNISNN